ncbi:N-acetylneuraminate synthase family protein [Winogradskyella aurantiaca]|uniref:N-acetylneuraminate synthase family protein n=1 Tax=Winogradskyella aurantiaca TaxID=2219558 RepID=UPI000E1E0EF6|nr:N-acetylneuraminate synthase family protein [Winogradskyella aurantiaca]
MRKLKEIIKDFSYNPYLVERPYVIAEAGVNHEGSMDLAKQLIDEAKEGGAHAIKFQTYKAETIASKFSPSYWDTTKESTKSQFELFKKYDKFWKKEYEELKTCCDKANIEFLSTPFDIESAKFLNDLMDVFKISSSDITNTPFIEYMCSFKKPIILSTGASYLWEIQEAVETIMHHGLPLCLMQCVLNYPTLDHNANLGMIKDLMMKFPRCMPGYSDHTLPNDMSVLITANLLGAVILEKHFTHDKTLPGNDHYHAMDKVDLKHFFERISSIYNTVGNVTKRPLESENTSRNNARRSLIAKQEIKAGKIITRQDLTWKRPAHGISPREINNLIGKTAIETIEEDSVLKWDMFK